VDRVNLRYRERDITACDYRMRASGLSKVALEALHLVVHGGESRYRLILLRLNSACRERPIRNSQRPLGDSFRKTSAGADHFPFVLTN
jgi:hypothetical protein